MSEVTIENVETASEDTGEFVRLVWLIEAARNGNTCTMNQLISHAKKFFTIEAIEFRDLKSLAIDALMNHIEKIKTTSHAPN